ncbi:MAG: hypothetical protein ABIF08_00445 [Nanoarchaeota archaeon]
METEEFELVPTSPTKRLERRLSKLEKVDNSSDIKKLTDHILDLISSNQTIIERMVESNDRLRNDISKLPEKMDEMLDEMKNSFRRMKSQDISEMPADSLDVLLRQMRELIEHNKKHVKISRVSAEQLYEINKRLKRIYLHNTLSERKVDLNIK